MDTFIDFIQDRISILMTRKGLINLFAHQRNRPVYPDLPSIENGIVFAKPCKTVDSAQYGYYRNGEFRLLNPSEFNPSAPFAAADPIKLPKGILDNYTESTPLNTIIGSFLANLYCIVKPMGNAIPFVNGIWDIRKVESQMAQLILKDQIKVSQYLEYIKLGTELTHFGELFQPTMSERSVTVPQYILKRRDELLEQHKDELQDAMVVASIEKELINMYKEYIGNDSVAGYLEASEKSYNVHAKQMHLLVGGIANFGGNSDDVTVVPTSYSEGWNPEHFEALANSVRKGSYSRGVSTQDSGAKTIAIMRIFENVSAIKGDCKSKKGLKITFDEVMRPEMFIGRSVMNGSSLTEITYDNVKNFKQGQTVTIRSPKFCKQKEGYCTTCLGKIYERLDIVNPGTQLCTVTTAMMGADMAAMHVESIDVQPINLASAII